MLSADERLKAIPHALPPCSSHQDFSCLRLWRGAWVPITLRVGATGLEVLDPGSKACRWRCDYQRMGSPGVVTLAPSRAPEGPPVEGAFAVKSRWVAW